MNITAKFEKGETVLFKSEYSRGDWHEVTVTAFHGNSIYSIDDRGVPRWAYESELRKADA
jgi:hypothetical protein